MKSHKQTTQNAGVSCCAYYRLNQNCPLFDLCVCHSSVAHYANLSMGPRHTRSLLAGKDLQQDKANKQHPELKDDQLYSSEHGQTPQGYGQPCMDKHRVIIVNNQEICICRRQRKQDRRT